MFSFTTLSGCFFISQVKNYFASSQLSFGSLELLQVYFLVTNMLQRLFSSILMRRNFLSRNSLAFSLKMINFRKNIDCPASPDLLAFQNGEIPAAQAKVIGEHLSNCEFCAAEIELYAHNEQSAEDCLETEIPRQLYELAEALLNNKQKNFSLLDKLLDENESLTLEKA